MKAVAVILISLFTGVLAAQTPVNKNYPVSSKANYLFAL